MYEGGKGGGGAAGIVGGSIVLPNTGGNVILTIVAIAGIVIGSAILLLNYRSFYSKKGLHQGLKPTHSNKQRGFVAL